MLFYRDKHGGWPLSIDITVGRGNILSVTAPNGVLVLRASEYGESEESLRQILSAMTSIEEIDTTIGYGMGALQPYDSFGSRFPDRIERRQMMA